MKSGMRFYLTDNGNILITNGEKSLFCNARMELLREVSNSEVDYLINEVGLLQFNPIGEYNVPPIENLPVWHRIIGVLIMQDNTNYEWSRCENGGAYSYSVSRSFYCAKYPDGSWRFRFIDSHSTSAEFSYDELSGTFQSNLNWLSLTNVQPAQHFKTQLCGEDQEDMLEKWSKTTTFIDMIHQEKVYIDKDGFGEEFFLYSPAYSLIEIKMILTRMKELGFDRKQKVRTPRTKNKRR